MISPTHPNTELIVVLFFALFQSLLSIGCTAKEENECGTKIPKLDAASRAQTPITKEPVKEDSVYALIWAPCYNGPSLESGRFWFKKTAKKPLALTEGDKYKVVSRHGDWVQVDVFGRSPWVQSKHVAGTLRTEALSHKLQERLQTFDSLQSTGPLGRIHAGVEQRGNRLSLIVSDQWHGLRRDEKEAYIRDSLQLFFGMGGPRSIPEKPGDYKVEIRDHSTDALLATWDDWNGVKLID